MATEKTKVTPQKLSREAYHALESVVGKEWVTEDRAIIEAYVINTDDAGASLRVLHRDPRMRAAAVVMASSTEEVQGVVRVANRYGFPIVGVGNMQLASAPVLPGTVMLSLRRMDKISVDEENMRMTIQPFIDYGKVHHEAAKRGLWLGGSGWHGAIAKPCSQYVTYGLWQSDLKYSGLARNAVGLTVIQADGSVLKLGSSAVSGTDEIPFTEHFPGPNLMGMIKGAFGGTRGIVTEITLKLHPWVGGQPFPEDRGRPSIEHYFEEAKEKKFDLIYSRHVISELKQEGFRELARHLTSDGLFVALEPDYSMSRAYGLKNLDAYYRREGELTSDSGLTGGNLRHLFREAGLKVQKFEPRFLIFTEKDPDWVDFAKNRLAAAYEEEIPQVEAMRFRRGSQWVDDRISRLKGQVTELEHLTRRHPFTHILIQFIAHGTK